MLYGTRSYPDNLPSARKHSKSSTSTVLPTMSDTRTVYQPIHPEMLPRLLPEYVDYHNANTAFTRGIHEIPWDPAVRKNPPVQGGSVPLKVGSVKDFSLSKCMVRVFTPEGTAPVNGWPVFIFYHGGERFHSDFALLLDTHCRLARRLGIGKHRY